MPVARDGRGTLEPRVMTGIKFVDKSIELLNLWLIKRRPVSFKDNKWLPWVRATR